MGVYPKIGNVIAQRVMYECRDCKVPVSEYERIVFQETIRDERVERRRITSRCPACAEKWRLTTA
jgi:uncharacterized protein with PIN domain